MRSSSGRKWLSVGIAVVVGAAFGVTGAFAVSGGATITTFAGNGKPSSSGDGNSVSSRVASAASGQCSKAEAIEAVKRLGLRDTSPTYPVYKVLCGAFAGAGSRVMVASIPGQGNVGMLYWAVFRWSGGGWQFLMTQRQAALLTAAGADIRETVSIYRPGDAHCCPSGGTKARTWHWGGSRFVASAWKQVGAANGDDKVFPDTYFQTPSGNVVCHAYSGIDDLEGGGTAFYAGIECVIKSGLKPQPPHTCEVAGGFTLHQVRLFPTGRPTVPGCRDDASGTRLLTDPRNKLILAYGQTWTGGGLRCTSAVAGLTCRNKSGHGFFLSRDSWRAF